MRVHKSEQVRFDRLGPVGFVSAAQSAALAAPMGNITRVGRHDALPMIDVEHP